MPTTQLTATEPPRTDGDGASSGGSSEPEVDSAALGVEGVR